MSADAQGKSLTSVELSYEEVEVGDHFETPSRDVTAAVIEAFAEMTGDRFEIHMSYEAALRHGFQPVWRMACLYCLLWTA